MVKLNELTNENSNKYFDSIVFDTLKIGFTSVFVGSDGYDWSIDSFIK